MTFLFSLIAIILSLASVVLIIIRIGIGLGIEFVERTEIREMKKKIDRELYEEWIAKLQDTVKKYSEKSEAIAEETAIEEIVELGDATRYAQIGATLLKVLSKVIFDVVKLVIAIIGDAIISIILVWGAITFRDITYQLGGLAFITLFGFVLFLISMRGMTKSYISLRSQFYELSENPSLSKAKNIMDELKELELIYA